MELNTALLILPGNIERQAKNTIIISGGRTYENMPAAVFGSVVSISIKENTFYCTLTQKAEYIILNILYLK